MQKKNSGLELGGSMKSEKFKKLEQELEVATSKLRKTEGMLGTAIASTVGHMNKNIKLNDILNLPILVPYGDHSEFKVIKITRTGMLDVESTINSRIIKRVTFDIIAHEPLYAVIEDIMRLYVELEEEKAEMNNGSVDLSKFRK